MFIRNLHLDIKPEHLERYKRLAIQHALYAKRIDPGIKHFDLLENLADPNCIHTVEVYQDHTTWERHSREGYAVDFAKLTAELCKPLSSQDGLSEARNLEPSDENWFAPQRWSGDPARSLFIHNSWIYVKPQFAQAYSEIIVNEVRKAKPLERGILGFHVFQNLQDPGLIHTYEVYVSRPVWENHYQQSYLQELKSKTNGMHDPKKRANRRPIACRNLEPTDAYWQAVGRSW